MRESLLKWFHLEHVILDFVKIVLGISNFERPEIRFESYIFLIKL